MEAQWQADRSMLRTLLRTQPAWTQRDYAAAEYECLRVYQPHNLETATTVTLAYQQFYNHDRPHQGLSCQNLPPRVAFPAVPPLPPVPAVVDADRWLQAYDGQIFARKVLRGGLVLVGDIGYYVKATLVKQHITLRVDAASGTFVVETEGHEVQRLAVKGAGVGQLPYTTFVEHLCADTRTSKLAVFRRARQQRWG